MISEDDRLIRLLTPPFVATPKDPGYIKGYLAGVRENGGQYTHAACWAVMAMAQTGRRERAARLLAMLSPVSHTATPEQVATYRLEPYAVAADVYGTEPHIGRGGWSWYTGSAGWMFRVGIESVLGLRIEDARTLVLKPCIPADWPGFRMATGSRMLRPPARSSSRTPGVRAVSSPPAWTVGTCRSAMARRGSPCLRHRAPTG